MVNAGMVAIDAILCKSFAIFLNGKNLTCDYLKEKKSKSRKNVEYLLLKRTVIYNTKMKPTNSKYTHFNVLKDRPK